MPNRKPKLAKEYALPKLTKTDEKETTKAQHCIKAIAGEVLNSRSVHLINFGGGGQVIALKSATALIIERYVAHVFLFRYQHIAFFNTLSRPECAP
tara:strand:- start:126 stop:413 length:288 start_codon:yes stop_codon:yes gene_type:complete